MRMLRSLTFVYLYIDHHDHHELNHFLFNVSTHIAILSLQRLVLGACAQRGLPLSLPVPELRFIK